jgi:hypothetical protein
MAKHNLKESPMLTATKILDTLTATGIYTILKDADDGADIDHIRYVLKRLRKSGKVEGHNQGGNCWMYSRAALAAVRTYIEQAKGEV